MSEPINFGDEFRSAAERLRDEAASRAANAKSRIPWGHAFLDECLYGGIFPGDLVLVGAATGVGKTEFVSALARETAVSGKRVHLFALEAETGEVERRLKFRLITQHLAAKGDPRLKGMHYRKWLAGEVDTSDVDPHADAHISDKLRTLNTYYRTQNFTPETFSKHVNAIAANTDLIIVDHLHYFDNDDENEHRGMKKIVQTIRDVQLKMAVKKPIVLVAHLRKDTQQGGVPLIADFMGSSDVPKVATVAIMISKAQVLSGEPHMHNTIFAVRKDRLNGAPSYVALCQYDSRRNSYENQYALGYAEKAEFVDLDPDMRPIWADRCVMSQILVKGALK